MKSKSMKKFMQKSLTSAMAVIMAIAMAAPSFATEVPAAAADSHIVTEISADDVITTQDGTTEDYASNITFTTENEDGSYTELSLADAKEALAAGKTVQVYDVSHAEGYGSVWTSSYDYTDYRTGIQIGEDADVAIGTEGVGGTLLNNVLSGFKLFSTSKSFNPVVINKADATLDNPVIVSGNVDGKDNTDGNADVNDFVGYGTAVTIYGDSVTTNGSADADGQMGGTTQTNGTYKTVIDLTNGGSITTYGVAKPAVEVDNGGDVVILGDGDDSTQEIAVYGGTTYDGFKNTADTVKMVSPPWVLGVVGNARATNMLGKGSTMVVKDSNVYAKSWGVLSTDSGSNPYLYAINSTMDMNLDESEGAVSGYGTYAIGNAQEYFLGSTFNVATYLTIAANGDNNNVVLGATKAGETINTQKAVWDDNEMSIVDNGSVTASETRQTVVNSENFGIDIWGQATVDVNDATVFNTKSAPFLVKSATSEINIGKDAVINASSDVNAKAESKLNGTTYGVVYQIIDNEDSAAQGISFPEGYAGPVFTDAVYSENEGWLQAKTEEATPAADDAQQAPEGEAAPEGEGGAMGPMGPSGPSQSVLNIENKDLKGNIYNGSGYLGTAVELTVNVAKSAKVTGAISATTVKHTTDGGVTQNTEITEADYNQIGHVMNKPSYNGANNVTVNVDGTWVADGTSIIQKLTIGTSGKVIYGTAKDANGKYITLKAGNTYENVTVSSTKQAIKDGLADFAAADGNWYCYKNGVINKITTIMKNKNGWWYVKNGKVDFTYTGLAKNQNGWWYVKNGKVDFTYTGLAKNQNGWWYVKNSKVQFSYNGLAKNAKGTWVVKNGKVNFNYTGTYKVGKKTYKVYNGKVK